MDRQKEFSNPILPGFYPDPSICRAGDAYYIVNSSFYYYPGLPVSKSYDLVHWRQIGNAISRPGQLDFRNCDSSEGLWAATIRYHNGLFYIVDTLDVNGRANRYNFIITAQNPEGPWSDAVIIEGADGIDPSLYFDEDGRMWFCANHIPENVKYPTHKQIYMAQLDPDTFQIIGNKHVIYDGITDRSMFMEGPHVYHIGKKYFLLTACGGTQTNHCVNFYRSDKLLGPYEPCPRNPVVSSRNLRLLNATGVSVTGHGDLVCTPDGQYYMTLLGIRPYDKDISEYEKEITRKWIRKPDRNKYAQYNLGRETFLLPMAFDYDDWPLADNENGLVNLKERMPDLPGHPLPFQTRVDNFESAVLDCHWCMRRPPEREIFSLTQRPGYLRLHTLPGTAESRGESAIIVRRQQHYYFQAACAMEFKPAYDGEEAGIIVTQNENYSYLLVKCRCDGRDRIECIRIQQGVRTVLADAAAPQGRIYLTVEGRRGDYSFFYGDEEHTMISLGDHEDGALLSTLVADGYLGTMIGMYASAGHRESNNAADFDWFRYENTEER
jgi:xylan 1,4-beta-xylosidase